MPGALAQTNVIANMLFGAISGSGTAAASAMGSIIGPIEEDEGYSREFSAAANIATAPTGLLIPPSNVMITYSLVAGGGSIIGPIEEDEGYSREFSAAANIATAPTGLLIPPSNVMITYSLVAGGASVSALFMAGYIPGILWGLSCMIVIYFLAKKRGYRSNVQYSAKEKGKMFLQSLPCLWGLSCMIVIYFLAKKRGYRSNVQYSAKEKGKMFLQSLPCLFLIIVVIGGIIFGAFTATEGSVVAVVYSLLLSIYGYHSIKWKDVPAILKESAEMTGIIIFLIGVSSIMSWVMAFTGIPQMVSQALLGMTDNKYLILLLINVILLIVGTFMDMTPAVLIFTPIFLPVCLTLGMNIIHFGIMIIFNLCIGTITPPVGTTLFVGVKVGKTTIEAVFKQLLFYFVAIFIVLMLVTYIPQLSLWLPTALGIIK